GIERAVGDGGIATLLGANGAGKTTTLRAIFGMVRTKGAVSFAGARIEKRATEDIARMGVAHVPDGRGTFLDLTAEENLRLGGHVRGNRRAIELAGHVFLLETGRIVISGEAAAMRNDAAIRRSYLGY